GAGRNLGVMVVDALGKRVADAEQVHQFGERIAAKDAALLEVTHNPAVLHDEGFEDAGIVVLRQPAEVRVAAEIVQKIGADGASGNVGDQRTAMRQSFHNLSLDPLALENSPDVSLFKKVTDAIRILVVARKHAAFVFERMAEGNVGDVVQQGGYTNELGFIVRHVVAVAYGVDDALGHPGCPEGMLETSMQGGGKNEAGRAELLDAPQTLEFRCIDDLDLKGSQLDIPVYGITNQLPRHDRILSYTFTFSQVFLRSFVSVYAANGIPQTTVAVVSSVTIHSPP